MKKVNFKIINLVLIFSLFGTLTISNFAYAEGENPEEVPLILESTETKDEIVVEDAILSTDNNLVDSTEEPTPEEIPNNDIVIEPLPTTTIHLQIQTYDQELYNDDFVVTACSNTENGTENTLNLWCAIQQLAELKNWNLYSTWGSYGVTYDIDNYKGNDFSDNMWWSWYSELNPGSVGVNAYILNVAPKESILLTYGIEPSKITTDNTTPSTSSTVNIEYQKFDWNTYSWIANTSSTFVINNEELFDEDGIYKLEITTTTPYTIYAKKDGFLNSELITITPVLSENNNETNTGENSSGDSSSNNQTETTNSIITNETIRQTAEKILEYFRSQQDSEGKIIDGNITDWAIMSFGANGEYAKNISKDSGKSLLDYEKSYNLDSSTDMSSCATYPRHILALLSAGVNKTDNAIKGLHEKIVGQCFANNTIEKNTYGILGTNDDIFALLSLLSLDNNDDKQVISYLTENILKTQDETTGGFSMGWGITPDATGASINALKNAKTKGINIDENVFTNATNYLKQNQFADGGWGYLDYITNAPTTDILTTSWVMMGINALTQTQNDWFNSYGKSPWNVLVDNLTENGYYTSLWSPVDWFGMKHAVPALLGKSWPIILDPIVEDFSKGATFSYGSGENVVIKEEMTTTTLQIPTTTIEIVLEEEMPTSTEEIVEVEENEDDMEILPVLYSLEENTLDTTKTTSNNNPKIEETRGEKIIEEQDLLEEIEDEQVLEDVNNSSEDISETTEQEKLPANKKIAILLGLGALLYGLFLVFKLFV